MNTIIENLQTAHEVISAAPVESFDLEKFGQKTSCGTLYCSLGWLAASGRFKEHMELQWDFPIVADYTQRASRQTLAAAFYTSKFANVVPPGGDRTIEDAALSELFGPVAFEALFSSRGQGRFDGGWDKMDIGSDRDLALWRLERQLELVKLLNVPEVAAIVEQHQPDDDYNFQPRAQFPERGKMSWVISVDVPYTADDRDNTIRRLNELGDRAVLALGNTAHYHILDIAGSAGLLNLVLIQPRS